MMPNTKKKVDWESSFFNLFPGLKCEKYQEEIIKMVLNHFKSGEKERLRIALCLPYATGKTTLAAILLLGVGVLLAHEQRTFKGFTLSVSREQLRDCLWGTVLEWAHKIHPEAKKYFKITDKYLRFGTSDNRTLGKIAALAWQPGNQQALAGRHDENIFMVFDEATEIPEEFWDKSYSATINTCSVWLVMGNPVRTTGVLFDLFRTQAQGWVLKKFAYTDLVRYYDQSYVDDVLMQCGGDKSDPMYRVRILGDFVEQEQDLLVSAEDVQIAKERPVRVNYDHVVMGVDVSTGESRDYSTIVVRNSFAVLECYRAKVTIPQLKRKIISMAQNWHLKGIAVDETGVGSGLYQELRESPIINKLILKKVSGAAMNPHRFLNRRSELYWRFREWIMLHGSVKNMHPQFFEEIRHVAIEWHIGHKEERITINKKYKGTSKPSPDLVDALVYSFAIQENLVAFKRTKANI